MKKLAWLMVALSPLMAQVPDGWQQQLPLGAEDPGPGFWTGAGLWAGDHHGPQATLTDSLGMGNALAGGGFHLEAGWRSGRWDMAAEVLGNRDDQGAAYLTLYRSHLWYRGERGWQGGFEQEPLVWGFGLNGGYLLGEAGRPFPRVRLESPMANLHVGRVPLGAWGFQVFMGRLDNHRTLSSAIQDKSWRRRAMATQGDVEAPFLMGYRAQAQFGPRMELHLNYLNLWGGSLNGRSMVSGYSLGNYLTAMTGLKDTLDEANTDFTDPGHPNAGSYSGKARSASEAEVGFRIQMPSVAERLNARTAHLYVSRGSKAMVWPVGVFAKNPPRYMGKDVSRDAHFLFPPNLGGFWNLSYRYSVPSFAQPNDTFGMLLSWPRVRAGLEYYSSANSVDQGHRTFAHGQYLSGFYYYGDPLGNALGGEVVATTVKLEVDYTPNLTGCTTVIRGARPFRDNLDDWLQDHPGQTPGRNRFTHLQQTLKWKLGRITSLDLAAAWQRQGAVDNVAGKAGNGFTWYSDLRFRWPGRPGNAGR